MKLKLLILAILFFLSNCKKSEKIAEIKVEEDSIICNAEGCEGFYEGPEFRNNEDVAHQFSNKMSAKVGDKLKELYQSKNYSKVDFENIKMSTDGMGSGNVKYKLVIPFVKVENKCEACTSFDHVGGWNHLPELEERKLQLQNVLMKGDSLHISSLKTTPEGLQEYWIQWRNLNFQRDCF